MSGTCHSGSAIGRLAALAGAVVLLLGGAQRGNAYWVGGQVVDEGGQGIAQVDIDAIDLATGTKLTLPGTSTGPDGIFQFFLNPGSYDLRFNPPFGFAMVGRELKNVLVMGNVDLDVTLQAGWFIFGAVLDPSFSPVINADIDVFDSVTGTKLFISNDNTDSTGFYGFVVPSGTYDLVFEPKPATDLQVVKDTGIVVSGNHVFHQRILPAGVPVFGNVLDPKLAPFPGVAIDVIDLTTGQEVLLAGDLSDSLGAYRIVVPPGFYDIQFLADPVLGYALMEFDSVTVSTPLNLDVPMEYPRVLQGVVTDSNLQPVAGARLKVVQQSTGKRIPISGNDTDVFGNYLFEVPEGLIDVIVLSPEGNGHASLEIPNVLITGNTTLDASLPPGVTITGRVTDGNGFGVPGVDFDVEIPLAGKDQPVWNDNTDALGNYSFTVPAGTYDLCLDPGAGAPFVARFQAGVALAAPTVMDFVLEDGVLLSGRVTDLGGNPWSGVDLDVRFPGTLVEVTTLRDDTDGNGNYSVVVPTGTFDLAFTPPVGSQVLPDVSPAVVISGNTIHDKILPSTATGAPAGGRDPESALRIHAARPNPFRGSTRLAFRLPRGERVRLTVYDVTGRRVRQLLDGFRAPGDHSVAWDGRDESGRGVGSGVYFVRLETSSGRRTTKVARTR